MKKQTAPKPLRLDRTTIARLDHASLVAIAGGREPETRASCANLCGTSYYVSCPTI